MARLVLCRDYTELVPPESVFAAFVLIRALVGVELEDVLSLHCSFHHDTTICFSRVEFCFPGNFVFPEVTIYYSGARLR